MTLLESSTLLKYYQTEDFLNIQGNEDIIVNGNSVVTLKFNQNQRDLPYAIETRNYGIMGVPLENTGVISLDTQVIGYMDNRIPYLNSSYGEGSVNLYTDSSNINVESNSIVVNVKKSDDEDNKDNIETSLDRTGLKFNKEYLAKASPTKEALNNIVAALNKINAAIPNGIPADIAQEVNNINEEINKLETKIE